MSKLIFPIAALLASSMLPSSVEAQCPEKSAIRQIIDNIQMRRAERAGRGLRFGCCPQNFCPPAKRTVQWSRRDSLSFCRSEKPSPSVSGTYYSCGSGAACGGAVGGAIVDGGMGGASPVSGGVAYGMYETSAPGMPTTNMVSENYTFQSVPFAEPVGELLPPGIGGPVIGTELPMGGDIVEAHPSSGTEMVVDYLAMRAVIISKTEDAIRAIYRDAAEISEPDERGGKLIITLEVDGNYCELEFSEINEADRTYKLEAETFDGMERSEVNNLIDAINNRLTRGGIIMSTGPELDDLADLRTWTSVDGRTTTGRVLGFDGKMVAFERGTDGKKFLAKLEYFSAVDWHLIQSAPRLSLIAKAKPKTSSSLNELAMKVVE